MRFTVTLIILFLLFFGPESAAQSILRGRVFELNSKIPIAGTQIVNLSTMISVLTDTAGRFAINASSGDLLTFQSFAYSPDTLLVINMKYKEIYLQTLQNLLNEVTVKSTEFSGAGLLDPLYHGQTIVYQVDKNGNRKGGISFRLWYWNKDSRKVRKAQNRLKDEGILLKIDSVFSPFNISKYIPLRGIVLQDFIYLYRPSVPIYRSENFNLLLYINDSYKAFKLLPPEKRKLTPLNP